MSNSPESPTSDYVYSDVEYRYSRRRQAEGVLSVGLTLILIFTGLFSALSIKTGYWFNAVIDGGVAVTAGLLLISRKNLPFGVVTHAGYWLMFAYFWIVMLLEEGIAVPHTAVNHYWFVLLAVGCLLVIHEAKVTYFYVAACFVSFVACEFAWFSIAPVQRMEPSFLAWANGMSAVFQFIAIVLIAKLFVVDIDEAEKQLFRTNSRMQNLLENMLPKTISERLRSEGKTFADGYTQCSVLFADLVGFTPLSSSMEPRMLVTLLDEIFSRFDLLTEELGLEKIKTIGDAYMVAAGLPNARVDHAQALIELAFAMRNVIRGYPALSVRIGINTGSVVAGIIGKKRFIYDLWGDTVNIASRMESHGIADEIQISQATYDLVCMDYDSRPRGEIEIKGRGPMMVYLVSGAKPRQAASEVIHAPTCVWENPSFATYEVASCPLNTEGARAHPRT